MWAQLKYSTKQHDQLAENKVKEFGIQQTVIATQVAQNLFGLGDQTCDNIWELYSNFQLYNHYATSIIENLRIATKTKDGRLTEFLDVAT